MIAQHSLIRIWEGCKVNDRKQQELLYKILAPKMLTVCMRYTTDRDEAQDVMQEGFIKIFKNLHNYRGEGSLEGWIRRIMVHSAISRYRKLKSTMLTDEVPENSVPFCNSHSGNTLEAKELMNIIQELPGNYRSVFNLYAIEGYSHQEIGSMLGITELLSRTTLHRARGILKRKSSGWMLLHKQPRCQFINHAKGLNVSNKYVPCQCGMHLSKCNNGMQFVSNH